MNDPCVNPSDQDDKAFHILVKGECLEIVKRLLEHPFFQQRIIRRVAIAKTLAYGHQKTSEYKR